MYILAKLVFKSYMPKELEKGMWFVSKHKDVVYGKIYEYLRIHELKQVPQDMDSYIAANGAPVEPYIVQPMRNADDKEQILATPDQIGWWDAEPWNDEADLEDLTPEIVNEWIYGENGEDGEIALEVIQEEDDDDDVIHTTLVLFHGKVTIRHMNFVDDGEEYEDDEDDEENWDDMDDWPDEDEGPEHDGAGFTEDDRIVNGQYRVVDNKEEELVHEEDEWPDWGPEEDEKADYEQRKKEEDL